MYRTQYPRPQMVRKEWLNLNGEWQFQFDDQNVGIKEKWEKDAIILNETIQVPFAFQTVLSGINDPSYHDVIWYKKKMEIPKEWQGQRVILHFGAVDYRCDLYVNEVYIGNHEGGHTAFAFDITQALKGGDEVITLRVEDPSKDETIPRGKQIWQEESADIWYTRTSGIWQTVWLEPVDYAAIESVKYIADIDNFNILFDFILTKECIGKELEVEVSFDKKIICRDIISIIEPEFNRSINLFKNKIFQHGFHGTGKNRSWLWSPENPNLFDVTFTIKKNNNIYDCLNSYFGLRKVTTENGMVYLNNKPYYQKLVLDQGYWRDGLLTAPTDEDLKKDIVLAKEMGFNGCRKHQKVEDPRFLYWADTLGFLVWGECASFISFDTRGIERLTKEWFEIIERDFNHPCIITWVPLNESWGIPDVRSNLQQQSYAMAIYYLIRSLDTTRLVISNDGWELTHSDICAIHNYTHGNIEETDKYQNFMDELASVEGLINSMAAQRNVYANGYQYQGEPILLTEFGGIGFSVGADAGWGYTSANTAESFIQDYERIMKAVYASKALHGYCYTQLTDVEQEINGLLTYDREPKCKLSKIKQINDMWHLNTVKK